MTLLYVAALMQHFLAVGTAGFALYLLDYNATRFMYTFTHRNHKINHTAN